MHLFKSEGLAGSAKGIRVCDKLMVSPAVHHLIVMAEDNAEVTKIISNLDIIDVDSLQIPALTMKEE
jgi:hypothetical protein